LVNLEYCDNLLRLTVTDHGIGLAEEKAAGSGIGLVAMRERAYLVNGSVSIESHAGGGTRVSVEVPLSTVA
jgi:two-component system sensor histidine kinase NreB